MIVDPPGAVAVMVIAAHPDDIEAWCAGTLARAIDAGATVRLLLVTSGDKGSGDLAATPAVVAQRREHEAREAARLLGIAEVAFLRQPDGEVDNTRALRGDLVSYIRRWRPAVLFTHDPEHSFPPYLAHRDHRAVGRAALDAVYPLARDPLSFPEQRADGGSAARGGPGLAVRDHPARRLCRYRRWRRAEDRGEAGAREPDEGSRRVAPGVAGARGACRRGGGPAHGRSLRYPSSRLALSDSQGQGCGFLWPVLPPMIASGHYPYLSARRSSSQRVTSSSVGGACFVERRPARPAELDGTQIAPA